MKMNLERVIGVRNDKTIYRDGDRCIKVFNLGYSKADVLNEAHNHAILEETGLNIPKVLEVTTVDGKWAIVTEFIKGKSLAQLMKDDPENIDKYLELLVDLQIQVHSTPCQSLNKLKDKMRKKIALTDFDATVRYDLHTRLEDMPRHNKVCHGDFNPSNIIISKDGTPYIIDWAHATQGNAAADAARTYLLFCLAEQKEIADLYLKTFCKKSDTAMQYVQKWLPIVAASQSVKGNPEERSFLLKWVNVVDFE